MKMKLKQLIIRTKKTTEYVDFADIVTFIHGPIGKGKSTVARLIDFCLGGDLERTPAIQQEFIAVELLLSLGNSNCRIERGATDTQNVRFSWSGEGENNGSVNAPIVSQPEPLIDAEVYNLSDLIFYLSGVTPIKVRRQSRDPDSPLVRLSIRDIWQYCYLDQTHLDSSFFHFEDTFRARKSQDTMRFFTGLHSEQLSQAEEALMRAIDTQRSQRETVAQLKTFMSRFMLDSEIDVVQQLTLVDEELSATEIKRKQLEVVRSTQIHPTDSLRKELRELSTEIESIKNAIIDSRDTILEEEALRAELITTKTKSQRAERSGSILEGVAFKRCPECGATISDRPENAESCRLCGSPHTNKKNSTAQEQEAFRRDLNDRIDQITNSIDRRKQKLAQLEKKLMKKSNYKEDLDKKLQEDLARYDSAYIESIRDIDKTIATLIERKKSILKLQELPKAIAELEETAGALQGKIDILRSNLAAERQHLNSADSTIRAIAAEFKRIMLSIAFPGVSADDIIILDPRNWKPTVIHGDQEWSFWDTGSGGKKTLFNVCYALAIHSIALSQNIPIPNILIIDGPTKNISKDENPELVRLLYEEIYRLAKGQEGQYIQFILIDSELYIPPRTLRDFKERRMAGEPGAPSLIPYYSGP